ncbi:hypothetical protein [Metapseudomonas resinovorans]|uniref:Uncharacterized protein n=1 Tax=Metapseudomonas resinovorans NBRC 106553 TaxID=1245471 RepID=S6ANH1_METRE|nr:hypothetical protein [Pseudomonas resinovorans]BAN47138.1 hypothetical protein PCA10_14060 [Pseudomonas resinovorans NBRC 106553]
MNTFRALGAALILLAPLYGHAACTTDEAAAKAEQLAAKVKQVTESNPEKAREINEEMKALKPQTQTKGGEEECTIYDQRIKELEEADRKAEQG